MQTSRLVHDRLITTQRLRAGTFILAAAAILLCPSLLSAQEDEQGLAAAADSVWHHELVLGATLSQVALKDWAAGGENAVAYTLLASGRSDNVMETHTWETRYQASFGQAKIGESSLRKSEDAIELESVVTWRVFEPFNPYASAGARTQFATGFVYDSAENRRAVSRGFDPLYLTQSAGFRWKPIAQFSTRLGAAVREVITSEFTRFSDDPQTPDIESVLVEAGLESVSLLNWKPSEEVSILAELRLFAPIEEVDRVLAQGETTLQFKAADILTATIGVRAIADPQVSPRTQIRESIAVGLSYSVF